MLDVLEKDWDERERLDVEAHEANGKAGQAPTTSRRESLIAMYMDQQNGRRGNFKFIVKALLSDGGDITSSSFQEVFEKEPRGPKKESKKRKRETLDLENDKFGDYFDDESISSGVSEPPTPQKPREARDNVSFGTSCPGLADSADIRMRLFRMLSLAVYTIGKPSDLIQLYDDFSAALKVLPLQFFSLLVSQRPNLLSPDAQVTILKELYSLLLPASYKDPHKVDPEGEAQGSLTMSMLEHCYAPYPANTVLIDDNAKLSLVVESSIVLLWSCDMVEYTEALNQAVEKGIKAREMKIKKKRTGKAKADPSDGLAQNVLDNSADRIRMLLQAMETCVEADV